MKLINIKSVASPLLVSGIGAQSGAGFFIQTFGEFEKVTHAMVTDDIGLSSSTVLSSGIATTKATIVSGNAVLVAYRAPFPAVLVSGDLISNTLTILAVGE